MAIRWKDLISDAVQKAFADPEMNDSAAILDYHAIAPAHAERIPITHHAFSVIGNVEYGSNEGIYGTIGMFGNWDTISVPKMFCPAYTLKTLDTSKEAYLKLGLIVNLICYYANRFIDDHISEL